MHNGEQGGSESAYGVHPRYGKIRVRAALKEIVGASARKSTGLDSRHRETRIAAEKQGEDGGRKNHLHKVG
jgi:hypothetical protein